jgi:hypothetical protein
MEKIYRKTPAFLLHVNITAPLLSLKEEALINNQVQPEEKVEMKSWGK